MSEPKTEHPPASLVDQAVNSINLSPFNRWLPTHIDRLTQDVKEAAGIFFGGISNVRDNNLIPLPYPDQQEAVNLLLQQRLINGGIQSALVQNFTPDKLLQPTSTYSPHEVEALVVGYAFACVARGYSNYALSAMAEASKTLNASLVEKYLSVFAKSRERYANPPFSYRYEGIRPSEALDSTLKNWGFVYDETQKSYIRQPEPTEVKPSA